MCIVAFAWQSHPRWKLIAIGNRDEMHARPAEPLGRWDSATHLLAGRDVEAGGTWLGLSEQGRFAVVTNVSGHGTPDSTKNSRGDLLKDFLSGDGPYSDVPAADFSDFNPFNLITVVGDQALVHSNRPDSVSRVLEPGLYGLSNGPLERPWPKSGYLNNFMQQWLDKDAEHPELLLDALLDEKTHHSQQATPSDKGSSFEPEYSPIFIRNPVYGTRCSTVVAVDHNGEGSMVERRYAPSGQSTGQTALSFSWPV